MSNEDQTVTEDFMTAKEAAKTLGYTVQHTRLLVRQGQLKANKFGRDWLIVRESVAEYKTSKKDKAGN
jgi:excisionase family DNA binding protein